MYKSLFIASPKPLDKEGWNNLLNWEYYEIAKAIPYANYAYFFTDADFHADDLKFFKYLTIENKDENNLLVTISDENRQRCRKWKADAYRKYAADLETGNLYTQNRRTISAIEHYADFFLPDRLGVYSEYSEDLPDKFYVCRNMYYFYHVFYRVFYHV